MIIHPLRRQVGIDRVVGMRRVAPITAAPSESGKVPRPYQLEASAFLRDRTRALLGDQMGLGKSQALLRALPPAARVIIVCPASVILVWEEEIRDWAPRYKVTIGETLRRPGEWEILVISYDSLPDLPTTSTKLVTEPMRDVHLILDEAHAVMRCTAARTQKVRMLVLQCGVVWGATGTPMLGTPPDLWGVLLSLNLVHVFESCAKFVELCGGKPKWVFDKRTRQHVQRGYEWGEVSPTVKETLKKVMLRRLRRDVLPDLPDEHVIDVPVKAPKDLTIYLDEVKEAWDDVGPRDLPPFELLAEARAALARSKIPAALELIQEVAEDHPLLVFSAHVDPILAVSKLKGTCILIGEETSLKRKRAAVEAFKSGKKRILAMTIKSGGAGLNLQEAGGMVFIDEEWTPGLNDQARARASRPGQKHDKITIWRLVSQHPVDVRLAEVNDEKRRLAVAAIGD